MKVKTMLSAVVLAALAGSAGSANAAALNILYVANSNNAAFQTFATSGQFAGSTWTQIGTGLTGNVIGGDLDRTATLGGVSRTVKSYMESFDLVILSTPITSGNYVDGVSGADWAAISKPILSTAAFAFRATGNRIGLLSGADTSPFSYTLADETTRVSNSALSDSVFLGTTSQTNLLSAVSGQTVAGATLASINVGGGEVISTYTSTTLVGAGIVYWNSGTTDSIGRTLANNRALFALNGTYGDLNADGQIVLGNLINLTVSAVPEPSSYAMVAGLAGLGLVTLRRRRSNK